MKALSQSVVMAEMLALGVAGGVMATLLTPEAGIGYTVAAISIVCLGRMAEEWLGR